MSFSQWWDRGFHRLCPVTPPDAQLAPESILAKRAAKGPDKDPRGKAPGVLRSDGLWVGVDFTKLEPIRPTVETWDSWGGNVGIKTGHGLIALDVDVTDEEASARIVAEAERIMGRAPLRVGRAPKAMLLYRVAEDVPYEKVTFSTPTEDLALVEVLTEGRQFVAEGIHPGTGQPYTWPRGTPTLDDAPLIHPQALQDLLAWVRASFDGASFTGAVAGDRHEIPQGALRGDVALVLDAINHLPNRTADFPTRDDYLRVGYAIKGALGEENEDDAVEAWLQWCGRWEGGNDVEESLADWRRMKPPYSMGADYIFERAATLGGWTGRASAYFDHHPPIGPPPGLGPLDLIPGMGPDDATRAPQGDTFEILRPNDIMRLPDPVFLIDGHIPEQSMGFLYGKPGCGKSFLALDWSLHAATGMDSWQGHAIRKKPGGAVLYLAREGSSGFKKRLRGWAQHHKRPLPDNFALIRQTINFMDVNDVARVARTVAAANLGPLDMIVVDTVSRVLPGADENLQKEMTLFIRACDALMDTFRCVVLGVHHAGKAGDMRGSSVLKGAGDFVFSLKREPGEKVGRLYSEKQKDAVDGWSSSQSFTSIALVDANGEVDGGTSLIVQASAAPNGVSELASSGEAAKVLQAMRAAWEKGEPWGAHPRSGDRWAVKKMASGESGIRAEDARDLLALWESVGAIRVAIVDAKTKVKGYEVVAVGDKTSETGGSGVSDVEEGGEGPNADPTLLFG